MRTHLDCDGEPVGAIDALDDAPDVLHGGHQSGELVVPEVREARYDARGYYQHICGGAGERLGGTRRAGDARPGTMGLRLTMANVLAVR